MGCKTIAAKRPVSLMVRLLSVYGFGITCIVVAVFALHPLAADVARFGWVFICVFLCILLVFFVFMTTKTLRVPTTVVFNDDEHRLEVYYYKHAFTEAALIIPYTSLWFGRYVLGSLHPPFNTIGLYMNKKFQMQISANHYHWGQDDIEQLYQELSRVGNKLKDPILLFSK